MFNIIFLQETYWTEEMSAKLQKEWEEDMILNVGSEHSKGTAILFKGKHDIIDIHKSEDSRVN